MHFRFQCPSESPHLPFIICPLLMRSLALHLHEVFHFFLSFVFVSFFFFLLLSRRIYLTSFCFGLFFRTKLRATIFYAHFVCFGLGFVSGENSRCVSRERERDRKKIYHFHLNGFQKKTKVKRDTQLKKESGKRSLNCPGEHKILDIAL